MANVPIQFFQAGATAIPTLMIAVVVGMKYGEGPAQRLQGQGQVKRIILILFFVGFIGAILGCEFVALAGLYKATELSSKVPWFGLEYLWLSTTSPTSI